MHLLFGLRAAHHFEVQKLWLEIMKIGIANHVGIVVDL
jgi:hypothetical protein